MMRPPIRWAEKARALVLTISLLSLTGCAAFQTSLGPAALGFSCRLPVGSFPAGAGGFIDVPSGRFVHDPLSAASYDAKSKRWLPVLRALISPEGRSYAASEFTTVPPYGTLIRIVDAASDKEVAAWTVQGGAGAVGWTPAGIYFIRYASKDPNFIGPELWVLDPTTGKQRLISPQPKLGSALPLFKAWTALGGGAVWSWTVTDTRPASDILMRVDLNDGHAVPWFKAGGEVLGWDEEGHPIVASSADVPHPSVRVVRLLGPNQTSSIEPNGFAPPGTMPPSDVTDVHGAWFAAADGSIWLLPAGVPARLTRVGTVPLPSPSPAVPPGLDYGFTITMVHVAGPCT